MINEIIDTDVPLVRHSNTLKEVWLDARNLPVVISHAKGGIRGMRDRPWIFCGDYTFRVFDLHPRGKRDISYDQSKMKTLPPIYTINIIYIIL